MIQISVSSCRFKSVKIYGTITPKTGRYTQGSKGLRFLSVFKFGDVVTW
jgi:hypothetical protein